MILSTCKMSVKEPRSLDTQETATLQVKYNTNEPLQYNIFKSRGLNGWQSWILALSGSELERFFCVCA
jgi:hypothetical protein